MKGIVFFVAIISFFFVAVAPTFLGAQGVDPQTGIPTIKPSATIAISEKGEAKVKNAVVFMIAGPTLFVRTYWDNAFIRWTIRTDNKTEIVKMFGGAIKVSDIKVGHILNAQGAMVSGSDTLNLNASFVRDLSLENEQATFSGIVSLIDATANKIILKTSESKDLIVKLNSATFKKGNIFVPLSKIKIGDKATSVIGVYHQPTETIEAVSLEFSQNTSIFAPRNFEGVMDKLNGKTLPTTASVTVGGKSYTVYLAADTQVLRSNKSKTTLERFVDGDRVRFYGSIRETVEQNEIDAEIIRDLDL